MAGTVISSAVRNNLLALQNTTSMQATLQNRLATGKKVNSALDNPANFFTASSLNSRASGLSSLLDGMNSGIKTLEAADNGMKAITKNIESMQANIRQARSDKSFQGQSVSLDTATVGVSSSKSLTFSDGSVGATPVSVALNSLDVGGGQTTIKTSSAYAAPTAARHGTLTGTVALNTGTFSQAVDVTISFGGKSVDVTLATGSNKSDALATIQAAISGGDLNGEVTAALDSNNLKFETVGNDDGAITVSTKTGGTAGSAAALMGGSPNSVTGSNGETNLTVNGTTVTLTSAETDADLAVAKANTDLGNSSLVEAYKDGTSLAFRNKAKNNTTITIGGAEAGLFGSASLGSAPTTAGAVKSVDELVTAINAKTELTGKVRASNDGGKLRIENLSTKSLSVVGMSASQVNGGTGNANTKTIGGNEVRKSLISQFNDLRTQIDKLVGDSSYNGINLLKADKLKLTFNEDGTNSIEIQAKSVSGSVRAIGLSEGSLNIAQATDDEFGSDDSLDARLDGLSKAVTTLTTQSSSFGAALTTIQTRQDFTKSMINTLQSGADSLVNADLNEESATLLALNTRQQLSQTALSLASQADQAVLRLF